MPASSVALLLELRLRNLYMPYFTIHHHVVSFERLLCRTAQHGFRAYIELRSVPQAGNRRSVQFAFAQWPCLCVHLP